MSALPDEAPGTPPVQVVLATDVRVSFTTKALRVDALRGIDLAVPQGEHVAVLGPSGSGKSTLLHILGALRAISSGDLVVCGQRMTGASENDLAAQRLRGVGTVFQQFYLMSRLTALDNVAVPAVVAGSSMRRARVLAAGLLDRVGLAGRVRHRPHELSGGEQQRVAIARALMNRPRLLLADEPTGNLDTDTASTILDLLGEVCGDGTTLIVVTHDSRVADRAGRVVQMAEGRVVADR